MAGEEYAWIIPTLLRRELGG